MASKQKPGPQIEPVILYPDAVKEYEPFQALEIRAIHDTGKDCRWRSYTAKDIHFYGVYGQCEKGFWHCIADCKTAQLALDTATIFNTFAAHSLEIYEHKKL